MATGIGSPSSRLAPSPDCDADHLPLAGRHRRPVRSPAPPRAEPSPPAPDRCEASAEARGAGGAAQKSCPRLPRGVQFNPSDSDLLWHLAAEVGNGLAHRHPFISEFIKSVDDDKGFSCTHPQDIPGVSQDGRASYFFHKIFELYSNENGKNISWQKIGTPKSIILDGTLRGFKEMFVLYAYKMSDNSPQKTDWRLHQYHIRNTVKDKGELVVSKIFYESQNNQCELAEKAPAKSEQEWMQGEMCADQSHLSSSKDALYTSGFDPGIQINDYDEKDELDHISLQERYRILLADKSSCPATISAGKSVLGAGSSGTIPKRNHEGTTHGKDICSMLQEISSAPPIIESMDDGNNRRLLGEDLSGNSGFLSISGMSSLTNPSLCEVGCCHDRVEGTENQVNGTTLSTVSELPTTEPTCGSESSQLVVRKHGTFLVDVKLEPTLEGYEIDPSESPRANSHHSSKNVGLDGDLAEKTSEDYACSKQIADPNLVSEGCSVSAEASSQAKNTHAEGSVPSLGVKSELTDSPLGLCETSSIDAAEHIAKTTHTRILDHKEGITFRSHQWRKKKTASYSTDKMLEKDAYTNVERFTYCSRRRRRKTATDSIEKALDEDAPGLLQILLNRGITVEEIKLYGAEEDGEMLPDCTESNFEDLENVITKLFPQRASLLKLSVARHEKGEKAIYCLSCLISLIEQSRYLQFRDCPVEWGWCRDLQSFIFVFRSHNRLVLERPEYGYATYFFEVVQSLPIEWQIRRLVTAMKLSGCGRTALIENRPLLVGEDLTEGEARVLEEYGWIRNCGLGTMLNYRDRVVHDRWTEKSVTDWRVKIGKLLMTGYAEGQTVATHVTNKAGDLLENTEGTDIEVKLEDPF
ncbi:uncharacterized protein LOC133916622 isoform X2 [Phragmites australis]|uniref:uncharacterized protein LOC133916622 isoform X2 n=1 Tax=Phragmites australis TaxID=29695 RepID=UPI002D77131A|nr:uncharacterized protein LOC133916622 isoform X2 [Phragmites australis]